MKAFFILLFLTNIIFALMQWLLPYEQVVNKLQPHLATETLKLLNEVESPIIEEPVQESIVAVGIEDEDNVEIDDEIPDDSPLPPVKLCYTLGPFKELQSANEITLKFKQNKIPISTRSNQEKEYRGMMVYVGGHKTRAEAVKTADSLKARGVKDYIIINGPDQLYILSLGVFSLKKNAERRYKKIAKLGYPVKKEARYRNRTIYWLDYSESENENLTRFIDQLKIDKGISRISRQCSE
ncbi:MAG: SPOR domain-containing protein [Gammaproteobacteria bacterium]|nr:SPOR domain-containing protein [Gammaproteobacteria bacterium]